MIRAHRYYRIIADDVNYPDRWFPDEPRDARGEEIDARHFVFGHEHSVGLRYAGPLPVSLPVRQAGRPVAFTLAAFNMPVVSQRVGAAIQELAGSDIERFPVIVGSGLLGYEVLNVLRVEDCLDEARTRYFVKWTAEDGRPDLVGEYRDIHGLKVDATRTRGAHIFRIKGSLIQLIVSEELRRELRRIPDLGVVFERVA